ncbi:MAG: hypothetical protein AB1384_07190 [Actinomycetota bacterium]
MRSLRPAMFISGLVLASLAESAGPFWFLAAAGSFLSFAVLLVLSVRGEAVARRHAEEGREVTISLPPPLYLEEMAGAADPVSCPTHPGWMPTDTPLPASVRRQSCRVP